MFLFHKGQTIDNRYMVVFSHKEGTYAETCRSGLLPQRFTLPPSWKSHRGRVNNRIFREQSLDVLRECVGRIDAVEPVGDVAQMGIEFVGSKLTIGYPSIGKATGKAGVDDYNCIPESGMVSADITDDCYAAQPTTHILKLWDGETATNGFLGCAVVHIAVKFGKRSHRCHFHSLPYRRYGRLVILAEMFLNVFVFRAIQLFLQVSEISGKQIAVFCQSRFHKPESPMSFCKKANHSGSDGNLNLLYGGKDEYAQLFIETIEAHYLGEMGTWLECVLLPIRLHQSPIACQAEVADGVECVLGFFLILYYEATLFKNVYLLLECKQLLSVSHKRVSKKCPALVRCIPCGREAVAGSIGCKGTVFYRNFQMFFRKSA